MSWKNAEEIRKYWNGPFCLKGIMSVEDAKKAVKIGASAIMISNHGGRQLDGSRSPFDQLKEILDAVGGKIEVICDGGIRRGCLLYTSPSPRDSGQSRMPSSA